MLTQLLYCTQHMHLYMRMLDLQSPQLTNFKSKTHLYNTTQLTKQHISWKYTHLRTTFTLT